jgi:PAS domain S-box-containing protein
MQFFKHLRITTRLILAFIAIAIAPILIAGFSGEYFSISALEDTTLRHLKYEVSSKADDIEKFLRGIHTDVYYLSQLETMKELIDSPAGSVRAPLVKRLEKEFLSFSITRPNYYQVRYIDKDGREIIRIDSDGKTAMATPQNMLQYKGDRYYFTDAIKYPEGICYVSQMDLNIERGEVETPEKPVVRFATPVYNKRQVKMGIVIINLYASYIIEQMQMINITKGGITFLANREGFYLSRHENKGMENLLGKEHLKQNYSQEVIAQLLSGSEGIIKGKNEIISYARIGTGDKLSEDYWVLGLIYPRKNIFSSVFNLKVIFFIIGAATVFTALITGFAVARHFTKPLSELFRDVELIAKEDFSYRLNIKTGDELEELAERINLMAGRLEESKGRLLNWNEDLKKEVEKRTNELAESVDNLTLERNRLKNILLCATEGIIVADSDNKAIMINPSAKKILGIKVKEIIGKSIFPCHKYPKKVADLLKNIDKTPRFMLTQIGSKMLEISIASIRVGSSIHGSMMVFRDVSEKEHLEGERKELEKRMHQTERLTSLSVMSAGIAHEIGNPLAAIKTATQAIMEDSSDPERLKRFFKNIIREVNRLNMFIKTFSNFAQPRSSFIINCSLDKIMNDTLFWMSREAKSRNINLKYKASRNLPEVRIDPQQIQQVFINLFINAFQAMDGGGRLNVGLSKGRIDGKDAVVVAIRDTGMGIAKENLRKIFDPFFTTKPTGTGLGLSITHRIVSEHKGRIEVESKAKKGTTIKVSIPSA